MSMPAADHANTKSLHSVIEHVFMPPKLPQSYQGERAEHGMNMVLCGSLTKAAQDFLQVLPSSQHPLWMQMIKMMELARRAAEAPLAVVELQRVLLDMAIGDVFCMHIRVQNAAVIVRRLALVDFVQFEVFEVVPSIGAVTKAEGKLLCSYPGPAVQVPADTFRDECFLRELSSFLVQMDVDHLNSPTSATSKEEFVHESVNPRYISELLVGILRGCGRPAVVDRITKRIGDEALLHVGAKRSQSKPWRRSALWLVLRVSLQSSLHSSNLYKPFLLFFHVHLLRSCVLRDFPSELLYTMRAKMARRLSKLGLDVSHPVYRFVRDAAEETEALLSKRWTAFQDIGSISPTLELKGLDLVADSHISLGKSYTHLTKVLPSASHRFSNKRFTPSQRSRLHNVTDFAQLANGRLTNAIVEDPHIAIADFELAVEKHLETWVSASTNNVNSSDVMASCIEQYYSRAKDLYKGNPEDNSIMILTIIDLWVALDRFAIQACPLLKQYSPEIPSDFLHCLLLHRSSVLKRALRIEEYLCQRHKEVFGAASVFSNTVDDSCFALKYFRTSETLQRLRDEISAQARRERAAKRAKLAALNKKSKSLLAKASKMDHGQTKDRLGRRVHSASCKKCKLERRTIAMKFRIHEWPLPSSTMHAELVVFELSPPRAFSTWRDITYKIIRDMGQPPGTNSTINQPSIGVTLDVFPDLRRWAPKRQPYRLITICSVKPSSDKADEVMVGIPAEESSVFVDNRVSFKLFDREHKSWIIESSSLSQSSGAELCNPPIPNSSPYRHIHQFVSGTQHTPNDFIAAQADCPEEINLHEFISFSGLRSGPRLQWLNIARELAALFLSFRREEVHTLITQAAWQLGPLSNGIREWHVDLGVSSFGSALLSELGSLLEKIKANWQEEVTVRTIALICSRLLASTTDEHVSLRACALLREARNLTYRWVNEVAMKLDSSSDTSDRRSQTHLQHRLCMLAATCFSTFDVCAEHTPATLVSEEDFSIAMQCAVIVRDNTPTSPSGDDSLYLTRMLSRHRRLLHYLEPTLSESSPVRSRARLLHADAYDHALARLWPGNRQGNSSNWHVPRKQNSRWICCVTSGGQEVHYDILTGELLVGGKPSGRLPQRIVEHGTYKSIFGARIFDVVPADIPGMDYMTRSTAFGYQILFSWHKEGLILQARKPENAQILQFIPRSILVGDFHPRFVDEYIHWLDLSTGELEFRPTGSPWISKPSHWRLYLQLPSVRKRGRRLDNYYCPMLQKPGQDIPPIQLIDFRSRTFSVLSRLLSPLELPGHIIVTRTAQALEISLPRLCLSFFVNTHWELECRSMPGYVLDKTQSCGTLFGLLNKLILCPSPTCSEMPLPPRRVIIPQGKISFNTHGNFTSVSMKNDDEKHVRWYEYTIDTNLGCLTSNTCLGSKLYQCYLHALTSHCLPDPLLCHTGTEEALYILRSAGCRSFQRLDVQEIMLLELIGSLTPLSSYHSSKDLDVWVSWNDLPVLSQHYDFISTVHTIYDHARALATLYDQPGLDIRSLRPIQPLWNRVASRNRLYYPSDLHISRQSSFLGDVIYRSRDVSDFGTAERVLFRTSWSIWNGQPSLNHGFPELWDLMNSWGSLGPAASGISLRYSRYWFEFDASRDWFVIYDLCRKAANENLRHLKVELLFSLSAAAYSQTTHSNIVPFFTTIALDERYHYLDPPPDHSYTLSDGLGPELGYLEDLVSKSALPLSSTPAHPINVAGEMVQSIGSLQQEQYDVAIKRESAIVAELVYHQWPDFQFVVFPEQWLNKSACMRRIEKYARSVSRNLQLRNHVLRLQSILRDFGNVAAPAVEKFLFLPRFVPSNAITPLYTLRDVLAARGNVPARPALGTSFRDSALPSSPSTDRDPPPAGLDRLEILIEELQRSQQPLLKLCGNELNNSRRALLGQIASQFARGDIPSQEVLLLYHGEGSYRKDRIFSEILASLAPSGHVEEISGIAGLWPRITPRTILRQLVRGRISTLPYPWKSVIVRYAVSCLEYQRSIRLLGLSSRQEHEELLRETESICRDVMMEWTPDWLLVQIEGNFLVRPVQAAVAREMISPCSKRNISLQLNMGEGKSSVIVPLVSSSLANGSNLLRIVTPQSLSNQMFHLLVSRLSGLADRPIFYVPISRRLSTDWKTLPDLVRTISGLYEQCVAQGGVLVVQPDHILSLKLMHIDILLKSQGERLVTGEVGVSRGQVAEPSRNEVAMEHDYGWISRELGKLQDWLNKVSRDVLDESDEILHPRYQLVYTAGEQIPVDDHPNRWTTIQHVFSLLQTHAVKLQAKFPKMLEIDMTLGGFPTIRILDPAIFQQITTLIIDDALRGAIPDLTLDSLPLPIRAAARRFMTQTEVSDVDHTLIHSYCAGTTLFNGILLFRGLLMDGEGIISYVLRERRWRVDYGLDSSRTLLAVPYRAKDVPSLRAEFAHPDIAISLTCLSYYYGGLTKEQVILCFDFLARLDNPEMDFTHWAEAGQDLPAELRHLKGVNMEDETQVDEFLVPLFSRNKRVVDFYLSQIVFPRAAREFRYELPTSAWDLVEDKKNVATGFSGTNDNRYLLPTSITQEDPDFVLSTNALVLQNLLRPENDHYQCTEGENGTRESASAFLKRLVKQEPEIRVLLDVGAQVLDLQNKELAQHWLSLRPDVSAAILVDDSDNIIVVTPDGTIEPFISSPFNRQIEKCVVYLDHAHTRGTDLKLPKGIRAAVTLGPKVTKDKLVQGCMRMRRLGKGHSVMFFAPGEVDRRIHGLIPSDETASGSRIHVLDIIRWAIHETCEDILRHIPHWVLQGLDHHKRFAAYKKYRQGGDLGSLKSAWLQSESRKLEEMYWIASGAKMSPEIKCFPFLSERIKRLGLGITKLRHVRMAEEQEREVNHEVELEHFSERHRPPKVKPAIHNIHNEIREFIETGNLPQSLTHISPLLVPMNMARALDSTTEWSPSPLATADFITTTLGSVGVGLTQYLRPVNWILSSGSGKDSVVVVISPYEANELLPIIRKSNKVRLHIYAPRVKSSMRSFSDLTFFSIPDSPDGPWSAPAHIQTELNLFAGQLYFDSRTEYKKVCELLALTIAHPGAEYNEIDGFVPPAYRTGRDSPFTRSKIPLLKKLIELRQKGFGYHRTHLGQILDGSPLSVETLSKMPA